MGDLELVRALQEAPMDVKEAALLLYTRAKSPEEAAAVTHLITAPRRAAQRRKSDRATDHTRRLLIGPRLPRELAEQYRKAAEARHLSLYEWASQALAAQYRRERDARKRPKPKARRHAKPPTIPPW